MELSVLLHSPEALRGLRSKGKRPWHRTTKWQVRIDVEFAKMGLVST